MRNLSSWPYDFTKWASLFAEGGLRSSAAASSLSARKERPWAEYVSNLSRKRTWSGGGGIEPSFYTDCLSIGVSVDQDDPRATPLLAALKKVPPPNAFPMTTALASFLMRFGILIVGVVYFSATVGVGFFSERGRALNPLLFMERGGTFGLSQ